MRTSGTSSFQRRRTGSSAYPSFRPPSTPRASRPGATGDTGRTAAVLLHVIPEAPSLKTVELGDAPALTGTPEDLAAALRAYADVGITHVQLVLEPCTPAGIEAFAPVLEQLRQ